MISLHVAKLKVAIQACCEVQQNYYEIRFVAYRKINVGYSTPLRSRESLPGSLIIFPVMNSSNRDNESYLILKAKREGI